MAAYTRPTTPDGNRTPYGVTQLGLSHPDAHKYLWTGRIVYVDYEGMKCVVRLDAGGGQLVPDVALPASGGSGPRSWVGSIPERGTRVILGWRMNGFKSSFPVIVSALTVGVQSAKYFEPSTSIDPELRDQVELLDPTLPDDPLIQWDVLRLKYRKVYPGNFSAQSSEGSELVLDGDVLLSNKSGSEFRLRESDNTSTLNVVNEVVSNAAGNYYRGLIRRNAFTFYQDLFPLDDVTGSYQPANAAAKRYPSTESDPLARYSFESVVPTSSPAYPDLLEAGLINEDGTRSFDIDQGLRDYPYLVTSDGFRQNYVNDGNQNNGILSLQTAYIEDRRELRHISDGGLHVIDEIDGATADFDREVFIEDVHGTVVGNDFVTPEGRRLYKRIMKMRLFSTPGQRSPNPAPIFEGVNTNIAEEVGDADTIALARLYRIQSPTDNNQYVFGVSKQGKVMLHIPRANSGPPDERGSSVEANIIGLVRAVVGVDPNTNLSADIRLQGGLNLDIGKSASGSSINLTLAGPIKRTVNGNDFGSGTPAEQIIINGNATTEIVGSASYYSRGSNSIVSGGRNTFQGNAVNIVAGDGGFQQKVSTNCDVIVLGGYSKSVGKKASETYAVGVERVVFKGVDSSTVRVGTISRTVNSGEGIRDSVNVGSIETSVTTGNIASTVTTGGYSVTVKTGTVSFTNQAGPVTISGSTSVTIKSSATVAISSPTVSIGQSSIGFAVAGAPGPGSIALDYVTGLPLQGLPTISIG